MNPDTFQVEQEQSPSRRSSRIQILHFLLILFAFCGQFACNIYVILCLEESYSRNQEDIAAYCSQIRRLELDLSIERERAKFAIREAGELIKFRPLSPSQSDAKVEPGSTMQLEGFMENGQYVKMRAVPSDSQRRGDAPQ